MFCCCCCCWWRYQCETPRTEMFSQLCQHSRKFLVYMSCWIHSGQLRTAVCRSVTIHLSLAVAVKPWYCCNLIDSSRPHPHWLDTGGVASSQCGRGLELSIKLQQYQGFTTTLTPSGRLGHELLYTGLAHGWMACTVLMK